MTRRAAALAVLATLAGCTAVASDRRDRSEAAELRDALKDRVAGQPQRCIQPTRIDGPQIIGQTLLYREGSRLWRTDPVDGCPSLRGDPIIIAEVYGGQLCRNDRFRTLQRGGMTIPGPYCRYGDFTPYTRVKR